MLSPEWDWEVGPLVIWYWGIACMDRGVERRFPGTILAE
jgi:hypothetical protein